MLEVYFATSFAAGLALFACAWRLAVLERRADHYRRALTEIYISTETLKSGTAQRVAREASQALTEGVGL